MKRIIIVLSILLVGVSIFAGISQHEYHEYYDLSVRTLDQNLELLDLNIDATEVALYWRGMYAVTANLTDCFPMFPGQDPKDWACDVPVGDAGDYVVFPMIGVFKRISDDLYKRVSVPSRLKE